MADKQLKIKFGKISDRFGMILSASEILQWFGDQSSGSSITIQLPSNPDPKLKAIAFCLLLVHHPYDLYEPDDDCYLKLCWQAKLIMVNMMMSFAQFSYVLHVREP